MILKIRNVFCVLLICNTLNSSGIAFSDWSAFTPEGNIISDNWGPTSIIVKDSFVLKGLKEWYFYDNHIIGLLSISEDEYSHHYFIFNESNLKLDIFNSKNSWTIHLQQLELIPSIWTHWIDGDWDSLSINDIIYSFLFLLFLGILLNLLYKNKTINKVKLRNAFIFGLIITILMIKLKLAYPYSL